MVRGMPAYPVRAALMMMAIIMVISLVVGASAELAHASTTFTVNSTGDEDDLAFPSGPFDGKCDVNAGTTGDQCTLRAAIQEANATTGVDTIEFNIPGSSCNATSRVCTINPTSELPLITGPVIINGYTQGNGTPGDPSDDATKNTLAVGNNAELKIQLDGPGTPTELDGLRIEAPDSTVKGLIISDWENGVYLGTSATGNTVQGNYIGTDASGTQHLGNVIGVAVLGAGNIIGGTTAGARNIISDNGFGVNFGNAEVGNFVRGNYIGTDASGTQSLGNNYGVVVQGAPGNTIGGTTSTARNVISGNLISGILISFTGAMGNRVQGNYIGTDASGTQSLGNVSDGVSIQADADDNTIGGDAAGAGNIISNNGGDGVEILYDAEPPVVDPDPAAGNSILSNSIYRNDALGIDLVHSNNPAGVTPNDTEPPPDSDEGPNQLQNYPVITSARLTTRLIGGQRRKVTLIKGTLASTPSDTTTRTFALQFFGSPMPDPSGFGEGRRFLGQESVETLGSGDASFIFITRKRVPRGQVVAATATNLTTGDTSEFSLAKTVN